MGAQVQVDGRTAIIEGVEPALRRARSGLRSARGRGHGHSGARVRRAPPRWRTSTISNADMRTLSASCAASSRRYRPCLLTRTSLSGVKSVNVRLMRVNRIRQRLHGQLRARAGSEGSRAADRRGHFAARRPARFLAAEGLSPSGLSLRSGDARALPTTSAACQYAHKDSTASRVTGAAHRGRAPARHAAGRGGLHRRSSARGEPLRIGGAGVRGRSTTMHDTAESVGYRMDADEAASGCVRTLGRRDRRGAGRPLRGVSLAAHRGKPRRAACSATGRIPCYLKRRILSGARAPFERGCRALCREPSARRGRAGLILGHLSRREQHARSWRWPPFPPPWPRRGMAPELHRGAAARRCVIWRRSRCPA